MQKQEYLSQEKNVGKEATKKKAKNKGKDNSLQKVIFSLTSTEMQVGVSVKKPTVDELRRKRSSYSGKRKRFNNFEVRECIFI